MRVTDYLSAIIAGVVVGLLGRLVLPGRQRIGVFVTFLIGVAAALLGTWVVHLLGLDGRYMFHWWRVHWDWVQLGVQVFLAVIGVGLANALTHTALADNNEPARRTRRRPRRRAESK